MKKTIFVLIEKNFLLRKGLLSAIHSASEHVTVHETDTEIGWLAKIQHLDPDVIILNPEIGNEKINAIKQSVRKKRKLRMVAFCYADYVITGNHNFDQVLYNTDDEHSIYQKLSALCHGLPQTEVTNNSELSEREKDIVRYIALGKTNKEVAEQLFISPHTVITHRKNITRKLGIKSVSGLTVYAIINKIIEMNELE